MSISAADVGRCTCERSRCRVGWGQATDRIAYFNAPIDAVTRWPLWLLLSFLFVGCPSADRPARPSAQGAGASAGSTQVAEVGPRTLPLDSAFSRPSLELSGLAWHGDTLVVLPQYPARAGGNAGPQLYGIARASLRRAMDDSTAPIEPFPIPLSTPNLDGRTTGYQGLEAIAFVNDRAYLLVESTTDGPGMRGHLLRGRAAPGLRELRLQPGADLSLPQQAELPNTAYEALTTRADTVMALFEANGRRVNNTPRAVRVDSALRPLGPVPFPPLEYRVTDATALDARRRFWVINYFYPGDRDLLHPATDSLARRYGVGSTHRRSEVVERLVEYRSTPQGIRRTDTPPLWLELAADGRNWEGVVRFGDGFLLVTDTFPKTLLAYVPGTPTEP